MAKKKSSVTKQPTARAKRPGTSELRSGGRGKTTPRGKARASPTFSTGRATQAKVLTGSGVTVAGIGASAGGLEAISELLNALPTNTGMAIALVTHLSPQHESMMAPLLSLRTHLPVVEVQDGMQIESDHIYVMPPNALMEVTDGHFKLTPRPVERGPFSPIDHFFSILAEREGRRSIGVVLSGTASDGASGLREIKAAGGITIVQEPETAKYDGMPRAAIATGAVDLILSPDQIAAELGNIARHPYLREPHDEQTSTLDVADDQLMQVFTLLRGATGVNFMLYKPPTIKRRLLRRMALHKLTSVREYVKLLHEQPAEVMHLYSDVLINVTHFFREPESFESLSRVVLPEIVQHRRDEQPIRVWVPGCSTGEEAYSVAITLHEFLGEDARSTPVQIFATDVSEAAVEHARAGVYSGNIESDISAERLRRFFTQSDGSYRVSKSVRELCVFARQDLTRDPPFSKLDLVVCRNVLIYMGPTLQKRLIGMFHYALRPTGFLMLGSAETVGPHVDLFSVLDKKHRIYRKRPGDSHPGPLLPVEYSAARQVDERKPSETRSAGSVQHEANRVILDRFSPPAVVVDSDLEIVQFRGHTSPFLQPARGEASFHLLKMVRQGLLHGVREAVRESFKGQRTVRKEGLWVVYNGRRLRVDIEVVPLRGSSGSPCLLVLFKKKHEKAESAPARKARRTKNGTGGRDAHLKRLEQELTASREYLQSVIQDLEAANEELQSANEEILSSNEELQSTNEELDTAREELQSTNEELNTVNEELHARNEEMSRINSDLLNLLGSVSIAIVIVNSDLRIRRFTPMAEKILNLIPTDVGRPITQINPNIECPQLESIITEVIDSMKVEEREVRDTQGNWYLLRVRPYKNIDNRLDGAVLALLDINAIKQQEAEVRESRDLANATFETVREPLLVLDAALHVHKLNQAFSHTFQVSAEEAVGKPVYELGAGQWDHAALRQIFDDIAQDADALKDLRIEHEFPRIGRKVMLINARRVPDGDNRGEMILLAFKDVTAPG